MKRIIAVALLLVILSCLCACGKKVEPLSEEDIRAICELATLECYYNNVAKYEKEHDNIFQKDRKMWIEYEGKATLGIQMSEVAIEIRGEIVSITMPKAEILSTDYNLNYDSYITSTDGWLIKNKITTEEQESAVKAAQDAMVQSILSNEGLLLKAEDRAKELIENYILQLCEATNQEYIIKWNE